MDRRPDAETRRENLDNDQPPMTQRPGGHPSRDEPMAEVLKRGDAEPPEKAAENPERAVPLTESERTPRESLSDLIPSPSAEPPEDDGQDTPPIAP